MSSVNGAYSPLLSQLPTLRLAQSLRRWSKHHWPGHNRSGGQDQCRVKFEPFRIGPATAVRDIVGNRHSNMNYFTPYDPHHGILSDIYILAFNLAYIMTFYLSFYLANSLTFYLSFNLVYILAFLSEIYSGTLSGILSDIYLTFCLAFNVTCILIFYLAFYYFIILHFMWYIFWHSI